MTGQQVVGLTDWESISDRQTMLRLKKLYSMP